MSCDVIEYVIEYCVQNRHNSIRYMEKVALNWHEKGIDTVDKAKMCIRDRLSATAFNAVLSVVLGVLF